MSKYLLKLKKSCKFFKSLILDISTCFSIFSSLFLDTIGSLAFLYLNNAADSEIEILDESAYEIYSGFEVVAGGGISDDLWKIETVSGYHGHVYMSEDGVVSCNIAEYEYELGDYEPTKLFKM